MGRFLSADTIVPGYANPQNLNRFSYVTNNPLRYTDPTGHMMTDEGGGGGGSTCNIFTSSCNTSGSGSSGGSGGGNSGGCTSLSCTINNGGSSGGSGGNTSGGGGNSGGCNTLASCISGSGGSGSGGGNSGGCNTLASCIGGSGSSGSGGGVGGGGQTMSMPNLNTDYYQLTTNSLYDDPEWCTPLDCVLSAVSFFASFFTFFPPPIDVVAFGVDVVATLWSVGRTNEDYGQGEISQTRQYALNITAIVGAAPATPATPWTGVIGTVSSFLNLLITATGIPN